MRFLSIHWMLRFGRRIWRQECWATTTNVDDHVSCMLDREAAFIDRLIRIGYPWTI